MEKGAVPPQNKWKNVGFLTQTAQKQRQDWGATYGHELVLEERMVKRWGKHPQGKTEEETALCSWPSLSSSRIPCSRPGPVGRKNVGKKGSFISGKALGRFCWAEITASAVTRGSLPCAAIRAGHQLDGDASISLSKAGATRSSPRAPRRERLEALVAPSTKKPLKPRVCVAMENTGQQIRRIAASRL